MKNLRWKLVSHTHGPQTRRLYLGKVVVAGVYRSLVGAGGVYEGRLFLPGACDRPLKRDDELALMAEVEAAVSGWLDLAGCTQIEDVDSGVYK